MDIATLQPFLLNTVVPALTKIVIAVLAWIIGRKIISFITGMLQKAFSRQNLDPTAARYIASALGVLLTIGLVMGIISLFGIETTSFAAILASAGIAIGAAFAGLLAHFAAGIFMLILRPFKVGDAIEGGGVNGVVKEMGLFGTTIDTADGIKTIVGNNKIFGGNIVNYTANPWRAAVVKAEIDGSHDHNAVMRMLEGAAKTVPNVLSSPAPASCIADLKAGPVIQIQAHCHHNNYLQVMADLNKAVKETLAANKINPPVPVMRTIAS